MDLPRRAALTAAAALSLGACSRERISIADAANNSGADADQAERQLFIPDRDRGPAVVFKTETLEGQPVTSAEYVGRVLVVNKWASWCPPCVAETPLLNEAYEQAQAAAPGQVAYLGLHFREDRAAGLAWQRKKKVPYPTLFDDSSQVMLAFGGVTAAALPSTVVLDRRGRIAAQIGGAIASAYELTSLVDEVRSE